MKGVFRNLRRKFRKKKNRLKRKSSSIFHSHSGRSRKFELITKLPTLVANKYKLKGMIGYGSFGSIFMAIDQATKARVAVKFEHIKTRFPQLLTEKRIYEMFHSQSPKRRVSSTSFTFFNHELDKYYDSEGEAIGIPSIFWYGMVKNFNVMVMEKLGPSLEELFNFCGRKFSLKTTLVLFDQMLSRLEYVHRDIKPENFLMGGFKRGHIVYAIDFGLAKKYISERTNKHVESSTNKTMTGTARYTSTNSHIGLGQSRRDDLESLGYMMVYFLKGGLPWQGLKADTKEEKYKKILYKKLKVSSESLCKGLPSEFVKYFHHVKKLKYEERPDYDHLRLMFRKLYVKMKYKYDFQYDWSSKMKPIFRNDKLSDFVGSINLSVSTDGHASEISLASTADSLSSDEFQ